MYLSVSINHEIAFEISFLKKSFWMIEAIAAETTEQSKWP